MTEEIKMILERLSGNLAVLRHETIGEFHFPADRLPKDCREGDTITLKISTENATGSETENDKYVAMRRLLEELIN